jgi:probable sporulation protein (polysaccharide deacetylase family)
MKGFWTFRWPGKWLSTLAVFLTVAVCYVFLNDPLSASINPKPIYQGNTTEKKVAFACNVFWGEEYLPAMLDTFAQNNIHITFFIGGSWAKQYPELLKNIAASGHELANHSYSHPHPNALSKEKNQEQITRTQAAIEEITGQKTSLYAPPYGEFNETVLAAASELGYPTIMWSIDTIDWRRPNPEIIHDRIMKKIQPGAIILMHPTDPTSKALPGIIKELQAKGYTITTVSDIIRNN